MKSKPPKKLSKYVISMMRAKGYGRPIVIRSSKGRLAVVVTGSLVGMIKAVGTQQITSSGLRDRLAADRCVPQPMQARTVAWTLESETLVRVRLDYTRRSLS